MMLPRELDKPCDKCEGQLTDEVINTETKTRQGWLCKKCLVFIKAIGRERVWKSTKENDK